MEHYSLIVVADETSPIRRFDVRRVVVKRALQGAAALLVIATLGLVDYVRVRIDHSELDTLREENAEQRARIDAFDESVAGVEAELARVREFERKVRIIANLPGSAAAGGTEVREVGSAEGGDLAAADRGEGGPVATGEAQAAPPPAQAKPPTHPSPAVDDDRVSQLLQETKRLGFVAGDRGLSLAELAESLEAKHHKLASSPAVWPTEGWLTSRFGTRISPFTGKRQYHAGIDIAGAPGTPVVATARGKVVHAGRKGPMGQTVVLEHGFGVRTHYGHNEAVVVKRGQEVERGEQIASLGSTGRSTGPHLHYTVEVGGRAVNPLDYIFD